MKLTQRQADALREVLVFHAQTSTSGCFCGGVKLGGSWPGHVIAVLQDMLDEPLKGDA